MFIIELDKVNNKTIINVSDNLTVKEMKYIQNFIKYSDIEVVRNESITIEQMKLINVLCKELENFTGYTKEEMKHEFKVMFCNNKGLEWFSTSPFKKTSISKENATEFINMIIEFCIDYGYNIIIHEGKGNNLKRKHIREIVPDINRYVIACLRNKTCCVCGSNNADLHHYDNVATIGGYDNDDGLKTRFMSLCREHHSLYHSIEQKEFENLYHLNGSWLTPSLVSDLKKIYTNHFKAFNEDDYK